MNYNDEQFRFGQVARLWNKIHPPGSPEWNGVPAGAPQARHDLRSDDDGVRGGPRRHAHAQRRLAREVHAAVTDGLLHAQPRRTTARTSSTGRLPDEIAWRNFYQVWFRLLNDYKKMGGRVTASDDAAYIYNTWGFGYIHELSCCRKRASIRSK